MAGAGDEPLQTDESTDIPQSWIRPRIVHRKNIFDCETVYAWYDMMMSPDPLFQSKFNTKIICNDFYYLKKI